MCNQWMIDVLHDIRQVAQNSALLDLAESLDDAIFIAVGELREQGELTGMSEQHDNKTRSVFGTTLSHSEPQRPPDAC